MSSSDLSYPADLPARRGWLYALLIAIGLFAAMTPTARMAELTGGNENIVIQTALEIRRDGGSWLLPTMLGEPRVKKPPLVAWIVAASLREQTIADLGDPARREAAYRDLAWQVRWTALLAASLTTLATFAMARLIVGNRNAVAAAAIVGTLFLFQRYMRQSTTDVHLTLWVTIANAALAYGLLRGRWTAATIVTAVALGVAFMCKGPVALVQTLAPAAAFALTRRVWLNAPKRGSGLTDAGEPNPSPPEGEGRVGGASVRNQDRNSTLDPSPFPLPQGEGRFASPASAEPPLRFGATSKARAVALVLIAIALFTLIAAPWFVYVAASVPGVMKTWFVEVNREGATELDVSNPLVYLLWIPLTWPWVVFLFVSGFAILANLRRRPEWLLPALQVWVPLLIMVLFRDRKERYMLPLVAPLAILCTIGIAAFLQAVRDRQRWTRPVAALHWTLLTIACVGLPIAGATVPQMHRLEGGQWFTPAFAAISACGFAILIAAGILASCRRPAVLVATTTIATLIFWTILQLGYARGTSGRSVLKPIADAILREHPTADVYDHTPGRRIDEEIAIYLNRVIPERDPASLGPPAGRPQVWITRQNKRAIDERRDPVAPPGWRVLIVTPERENKWWTFVRE